MCFASLDAVRNYKNRSKTSNYNLKIAHFGLFELREERAVEADVGIKRSEN